MKVPNVTAYHFTTLSVMLLVFTAGCSSLKRSGGDSANYQAASHLEEQEFKGDQTVLKYKLPSTEELSATSTYHFAMAQAHSAAGQSERAIEAYKLALAHDPKSGLIYSRLASEWLRLGQFSNALSVCEDGLKQTQSVELFVVRGLVFSHAQEFDSAAKDFKRAHELDPKQENFALMYAEALVEGKRVDAAVRFLEKFEKRPEAGPQTHFALARIYDHQRQDRKSEAQYLKALQEKPDWDLASLGLSQLYIKTNRQEKAMTVLKDSFEENQDLASAQMLALILLKAEKFKESIPYLEHLRINDPQDLNSMIKLSLVYMELKDYEKAEPLLKDILAKAPDSDRVRYYLANLYEEKQLKDLAVENYLNVPESSRLYSESILRAAQIQASQKRFDRALEVLAPALSKSHATSGIYVWSSYLYRELGQMLQAKNLMEQAYRLFPLDNEVTYLYGQLLDQTGERFAAIKILEKLIERSPAHVEALNYTGYTYLELNTNSKRAGELLERAHRLNPQNPYVMDSLGYFYLKSGQSDKAVALLEKSFQQLPNEIAVVEHLADAYAAYASHERAKDLYLKLSKLTSDDERRQYYSTRIAEMESRLLRSGPSRSIASDSKKD